MKIIYTEKVKHKGQLRIRLKFGYDRVLAEKVKEIQDCRWSQSMKSWHIPHRNDYVEYLSKILPGVLFKSEQKKSQIKVVIFEKKGI